MTAPDPIVFLMNVDNTLLDAIAQRYPAHCYVMVDDKLRILAATKKVWVERLTTVFPHQGTTRSTRKIAPPNRPLT